MSITLSATIAETRLGQGAGGITGLHYSYQQQKGMPQPPIGRKSLFTAVFNIHIALGTPQQFRWVCQLKTEVETFRQKEEVSFVPIHV